MPARPRPSAAVNHRAPDRDDRRPTSTPLELAVAPGLVDVALNELRELARRAKLPIPVTTERDDAIAVAWPGDPRDLHALRTVQSVARVWRFAVPRPKALLGDAALRELLAGLRALRAAAEPARFSALRLSAAGRQSPVMQRLASALAEGLELPLRADGDLLVRLRPAAEGGWEVLARTTPRPLTVRPWRVCDRPGGLDTALAAALVRLAGVHPNERVCNPMLGSGTLLIERAMAGPAACLHGFDLDPAALACAERNAAAAGVGERLRLWRADAAAVSHETDAGSPSPVAAGDEAPTARYDLLLVDPPWGDAVGEHAANAALYATLLTSLARLAVKGGRLVFVTHEVRLTERLLAGHPAWRLHHQRRVWQGGHRPLCALLERLPGNV